MGPKPNQLLFQKCFRCSLKMFAFREGLPATPPQGECTCCWHVYINAGKLESLFISVPPAQFATYIRAGNLWPVGWIWPATQGHLAHTELALGSKIPIQFPGAGQRIGELCPRLCACLVTLRDSANGASTC